MHRGTKTALTTRVLEVRAGRMPHDLFENTLVERRRCDPPSQPHSVFDAAEWPARCALTRVKGWE